MNDRYSRSPPVPIMSKMNCGGKKLPPSRFSLERIIADTIGSGIYNKHVIILSSII